MRAGAVDIDAGRPSGRLRQWGLGRVSALAPLGIIVVVAAMAAYGHLAVDTADLASGGTPFVAPLSPGHLLGTDHLGRDLASQVLAGLGPTILVGLTAAASSTLLGVGVGAVAGFFGGRIDSMLMRVAELFQTLPKFVVALIVVALFGSSTTLVITVIGLLIWPQMARVARSQFLSLRETPFVEAAGLGGMPRWRIILQEMLPNVFGPILVIATLNVAAAILIEAGLSFFGLGDPSRPTLGALLELAQPHLRRAWWLSVVPGVVISLVILAFNLLGDSLADHYRQRVAT